MPKPNPSNPTHCGKPMRRNGYTSSGAVQYRCSCGYTQVDSDRRQGGQPLGAKPMTQTERTRRYRAKKKLLKVLK